MAQDGKLSLLPCPCKPPLGALPLPPPPLGLPLVAVPDAEAEAAACEDDAAASALDWDTEATELSGPVSAIDCEYNLVERWRWM